jgi:hypothetical protein
MHSGENKMLENSENTRKEESSSPASEHETSDFGKVTAYRNVGCYKDALPRAVPLLEGWLDSIKYIQWFVKSHATIDFSRWPPNLVARRGLV